MHLHPPAGGRRAAPVLALLTLVLAAPALAQPAPARGSRADVDASIRLALRLEQAGQPQRSIELLRAAAQRSGLRDAKARYFLARFYYTRRRQLAAAGDRAGAREQERLALVNLRAARDLGRQRAPGAEPWSTHAQARLHERARRTPLLDQHREGGRYPWGYCGPTALRMALRLEGLTDPGADATALHGARPYQPGTGSWLYRLADRAAELGLRGAADTTDGTLARVVASLDDGLPVLISGRGLLRARFEDGAERVKDYGDGHYLVAVGYVRTGGAVSHLVLNDSDTGRRLRMAVADARRFFRGDGAMWMVTYGR